MGMRKDAAAPAEEHRPPRPVRRGNLCLDAPVPRLSHHNKTPKRNPATQQPNPALPLLDNHPYSPRKMSHNARSQSSSRLSTVPSQKPRQLSHLQAQLAQLTANMADLESLVRMTAGQAQDMRALGGYSGAM
jgi:hypothetical protein